MKYINAIREVPRLVALAALLTVIAGAVQAAVYYRWTDENGVTQFTSTPPAGGIPFEKVKTSGAGPVAAEDEPTPTPTPTVRNTGLEAEVKDPERCEAERERLRALQSGRRIRMSTDDGGYRWLSREEIQQEIQASQQAIAESC